MRPSSLLWVPSFLGTIVVWWVYRESRVDADNHPLAPSLADRPKLRLALRTVCATMWPLTLLAITPHEVRDCYTCLLPTLLWSLVVWWIDVRPIVTGACPTKHRGVRLDPSVVTGLTFGMCALAGVRADTPRLSNQTVYALVACTLFVLPKLELAETDEMYVLVSEVQRAVLLHCIGVIVTSVCLARVTAAHAAAS
jgi:hypothetical protein